MLTSASGRSEIGRHRLEHRRDLALDTNVEAVGAGGAAARVEATCDLRGEVEVAVRDRDRIAVRVEPLRDRAAEAAARPCDEGDGPILAIHRMLRRR